MKMGMLQVKDRFEWDRKTSLWTNRQLNFVFPNITSKSDY